MISLQIDKCIDINGHAQLATNIGYIDGDVTTSNFFICKERPKRTTGNDVSRYWRTSTGKWNEMEGLIQSPHWRGGLGDGLSETLHSDWGGSDSISKVLPLFFLFWLWSYCCHCCVFSFRESVEVIKTVKFINRGCSNYGRISVSCQEPRSEHTSDLLHTEVIGLSSGVVLTPAFQHRDEVQVFSIHQEEEDTQILADDKWVVKLAYS